MTLYAYKLTPDQPKDFSDRVNGRVLAVESLDDLALGRYRIGGLYSAAIGLPPVTVVEVSESGVSYDSE